MDSTSSSMILFGICSNLLGMALLLDKIMEGRGLELRNLSICCSRSLNSSKKAWICPSPLSLKLMRIC